jgi:hypothetical protein
MGHKGYLMAKEEDIARQETRAFLGSLRDALSQPPLPATVHRSLDRFLELLAEQDLGRRLASRDRVDAMLAELDGRADL